MRKVRLSIFIFLFLLGISIFSPKIKAQVCQSGITGGFQVVECFVQSDGYGGGYCGQKGENRSCYCPESGASDCSCSISGVYADGSCQISPSSPPLSVTCTCSGDGSTCYYDGATCGTYPYSGKCEGCTSTGSCYAEPYTATLYCSGGSVPTPTPTPTGSTPTPTPTIITPTPTPIPNYTISGTFRSSITGLCSAASTTAVSVAGANTAAYLGATAVASTASTTGYSFSLEGGKFYSIYLTIPSNTPYVCACGMGVDAANKVCKFDITPSANQSGLNFYLQPTFSVSGSFLYNENGSCVGGTGATIPSAATRLYDSSNTLIASNTGTTSYSFSNQMVANQNYDIRLTIPVAAPYICGCETSISTNNKLCQLSVTANSNLTGQNFHLIPLATVAGNFFGTPDDQHADNSCGLVENTSGLSLSDSYIYITQSGNSAVLNIQTLTGNNSYSFANLRTDWNYDLHVLVTEAGASGEYICACPLTYGGDQRHCAYTDTDVVLGTNNRNFYFVDNRLGSSSWFQVFGGNIFAQNSIRSSIPNLSCSSSTACIAALIVNSSSNISSGFPMILGPNNNAIQSNSQTPDYLNYIHQSERGSSTTNDNSYAVNQDINQISFDYFLKNIDAEIHSVPAANINFNTLKAEPWWQNDATNYVLVSGDVNINENSGFTLASNQSLVIFIDNGNLNINDSNPNGGLTSISSVAPGGLLVFIVRNNINISPNVGHTVSISSPSGPTVNSTNANLAGVFIAGGSINFPSNPSIGASLPDKKFIGAGSFIGWSGITLNRVFEQDGTSNAVLNSYQAVENFLFRPDFTANWPIELKTSSYNWRELNPQQAN